MLVNRDKQFPLKKIKGKGYEQAVLTGKKGQMSNNVKNWLTSAIEKCKIK